MAHTAIPPLTISIISSLGQGKQFATEKEEMLYPETCHICKKGSVHNLINIGEEDLVMLTVVVER